MREFEKEAIEIYKQARLDNTHDAWSVEDSRRGYIDMLRGCIESESKLGTLKPAEEARDRFKLKMLENNWPIEDMELMEKLFDAIHGESDPKLKAEGEYLLNTMQDFRLDTYGKHQNKMIQIESFVSNLKPDTSEELMALVQDSATRKPSLGEFPGDTYLKEQLDKSVFDPYYVAKISHGSEAQRAAKERLRLLGSEHNRYRTEDQKNAIRRRGVYVLPRLNQDELDHHERNVSQKKYKTAMSQRQAMKQIFGEEKYAEIDSMYMADDNTRRIPMHNARGNAQLDEGERVLEFDFAGSGFTQARKEHHGLSGKDKTNGKKSTQAENDLTGQYGKKVKKVGDLHLDDKSFVRRKVTSRNGKAKYRYTIPGPSCTFKGWLDTGKYRISNNVEISLKASQDFLKPLMEEYIQHKNEPGYKMKPVHLNFYGHSRGAVAASEAVFEVYNWLKSQKGYEGFLDNVHFDLVQRDPVPGPDVIDQRRRKPDLREIRNLASTTIVTTLADKEVVGMLFRPQRVRGQKRLIIGTTPHGVGLEGADNSQKNEVGDGMAHQYGYYDSETKEFYRGSGINDLPRGVYLTDEKHNLIRVTKYSQVDKMINLVIPVDTFTGGQEARQMTIREEVKNWFLDNGDALIYKNEEQRQADLEEFTRNRDYILGSKNHEFDQIKKAIRKQMEVDADETLDAEAKRIVRQSVIWELREVMNAQRIEKVDKSKEADITKRTDNKEWNALCDLYILMKTEDNYQLEKQKAFADYKRTTEEVGDLMRCFGDVSCAAKQLSVIIEDVDPAKCQDARALFDLAVTFGNTNINDTPATLDVKSKQLLSYIELHRGQDRQRWSSNTKLDQKIEEFADRIYDSIRMNNRSKKSILHDENIKDKTFQAILDESYEGMNAETSEEKRKSFKAADRCKDQLEYQTARAKMFYKDLMSLNVNERKDSKQFTAMHKALRKVAELTLNSSPVEIQQAFIDLSTAAKTYAYKIEKKGGGNISLIGKRGAERYDIAYDLIDFSRLYIQKDMSTSIMATKGIRCQLANHRELVGIGNLMAEEHPLGEIKRYNTIKKNEDKKEKTNNIKRSRSFGA